jgi:hypothetical protein
VSRKRCLVKKSPSRLSSLNFIWLWSSAAKLSAGEALTRAHAAERSLAKAENDAGRAQTAAANALTTATGAATRAGKAEASLEKAETEAKNAESSALNALALAREARQGAALLRAISRD